MAGKRKQHTAAFKAQVALAAIKALYQQHMMQRARTRDLARKVHTLGRRVDHQARQIRRLQREVRLLLSKAAPQG